MRELIDVLDKLTLKDVKNADDATLSKAYHLLLNWYELVIHERNKRSGGS